MQIAHGLAAAHEKGIIHRDLKPENLFLTKDGRVKILDFGLAKLTQADPGIAHTSLPTVTQGTEAGVVMGTAGYMSPEQVRGMALDPRSDIFSFGAILYEMLSGKRAFHGDTPADTMSSILKEDPPELSETNRNVSPALERIVQHCLEKNPESRFHSASDIAFDLEHLSGLSGTTARVATAGSGSGIGMRKVQPSRKLLLALAAGLGHRVRGVWSRLVDWAKPALTRLRPNTSRSRFAPVPSAMPGSRPTAASFTARRGRAATTSFICRARTIQGRANWESRMRSCFRSPRTENWRFGSTRVSHGGYARSGTLARVPLSGGTPREVLDNVGDADWSANGESMAVVRYVPENNHWRLEYPIGKVLLDSINWISHPKISPDGKWIAFADHENPDGDDEGSVAVIGADGNGKREETFFRLDLTGGDSLVPGGR